jgi:hypothetical protein
VPAITPTRLDELLQRVREEADCENDPHKPDATITRWLNSGIAELYGLLTTAYGQEYFSAQQQVAVVAGTESYPLPADFLKSRRVDLALGGGRYLPCRRINLEDADRYSGSQGLWAASLGPGSAGPAYYLLGGNIVFVPPPQAAATVRLTYIPRATVLVNPGDTWDGYNGWEEFAVVEAAIRCKGKEETDASDLKERKAALKARIEQEAANRDAGDPVFIRDDADCFGDW